MCSVLCTFDLKIKLSKAKLLFSCLVANVKGEKLISYAFVFKYSKYLCSYERFAGPAIKLWRCCSGRV
uniref:Uncharacterized protein n=1 Tax=Arundo donax TaxID=35708 RepID=A0A0A9HA82_ARUDO